MRRTATVLLSLLAPLALVPVALVPAATADAAPTVDRATVRTVTYPHFGAEVTLDHLDRIDDTSPAFQRFVERRLTRLWHQNDPRERCRTAATMIVKRWRSDGYAFISDMGNFAPCPDGGYVQIAVRTDGRWRTPVRLGTQEVYGCRVLERFDVPAAIVPDRTCYDGKSVVSYPR
ncbi:hypothetical protein KDN32_08960 [Nocardioides sp. J2M5]|uniref:hypothetical protein n=1 Tax=Nocardioides palaemonis TaxID=2829810 RepID=UPI001BA98564|nr:hypothetical protein [Nocardioides palaemonis]MBS2937874.1 hypothetical protein [Nocardioides palaemonis]